MLETDAPRDATAADIFSVLAELNQPSTLDTHEPADSELIFVGAKNSGKSTLIHALMMHDDPPQKTTVALEYRFVRNTTGRLANIWELGGGIPLSDLLRTVLLPHRAPRPLVAITLDMSEPGDALASLQIWVDAIRAHADTALKHLCNGETGALEPGALEPGDGNLEQLSNGETGDAAESGSLETGTLDASEVEEAMRRHTSARGDGDTSAGWESHEDAQRVRPVHGVALLVVAHKWDLFESRTSEAEHRQACLPLSHFAHLPLTRFFPYMTSEYVSQFDKQLATRALRYFAHLHGASLVCCEHHDRASLSRLRHVCLTHAFNSPRRTSVDLESSRCACVRATLDSFKSIGEPPCVEGSSEGSLSDEERWQRAYEAVFCQNGMKKHGKKESRDLLSMVDAEKYAEECIDVLRLEKRDELERMKKESSAE